MCRFGGAAGFCLKGAVSSRTEAGMGIVSVCMILRARSLRGRRVDLSCLTAQRPSMGSLFNSIDAWRNDILKRSIQKYESIYSWLTLTSNQSRKHSIPNTVKVVEYSLTRSNSLSMAILHRLTGPAVPRCFETPRYQLCMKAMLRLPFLSLWPQEQSGHNFGAVCS